MAAKVAERQQEAAVRRSRRQEATKERAARREAQQQNSKGKILMTATPADDFEDSDNIMISDAQRSYLESSGPGDDDLQSPRAFSAALSTSKLKGKVQEFTDNVTAGKDNAAHYQTL